MKRFFIDSSVLFSAAYSRTGHARDLLSRTLQREVALVVSELVFKETRRNLADHAPGHTIILDYLLENIAFELVRPTKRQVLAAAGIVALKDAPIVAAARRARVDALVTFDQKHLLGRAAVAKYVRAPVLTPKAALARLRP